jgi:UDP-N-acetylmuramoyl-L-alanyl-D-glutamate--2,6-diaminopimelate ligase
MAPSELEPSSTTLRELANALRALRVDGDASVAVSGVRQIRAASCRASSSYVRAGAKRRAEAERRDRAWRRRRDGRRRPPAAPPGVPVLVVRNVRAAIARAAAIVYGDPTRSLSVVGITGTNGKTTTSYLVCRALEATGARPGLIGTIGYRFEDWSGDAAHPTPESADVARIAKTMLGRGASHLVMEVSSHALAQARVDAVHFRAAAFTNLTQDHLEFHGSMAAYGEAKARLFVELAPDVSIINIDDLFGRDLATARPRSTGHGVGRGGDGRRHRAGASGPRFPVDPCERAHAAWSGPSFVEAHRRPQLAQHADGARRRSALVRPRKKKLLPLLDAAVPGRLERCDGPGDDLVVLVDYAHTPDAPDRRAVASLNELRQPKTPPAVSSACSDAAGTATEQARPHGARWPVGRYRRGHHRQPRTEDPDAIVQAILPGLEGARAVVVELDRGRAIADAINGARSGDVVLIAGKGHETYQIVGDVTRHFDDREQAREALARRRLSKRAKG